MQQGKGRCIAGTRRQFQEIHHRSGAHEQVRLVKGARAERGSGAQCGGVLAVFAHQFPCADQRA